MLGGKSNISIMKPITGKGREGRRDDVIAVISGAIPRNVGC